MYYFSEKTVIKICMFVCQVLKIQQFMLFTFVKNGKKYRHWLKIPFNKTSAGDCKMHYTLIVP